MKHRDMAQPPTRGSREAELTECPHVVPPAALDALVLQRCSAALNSARNAPEPLHVRAREGARLLGKRAAAALRDTTDALATAAHSTEPAATAKTEV
jgi:hypothetical protein